MREYHVRCCEQFQVKLPGLTRQYVIKWTVDKIKELIEKVIKPKHDILIEK